MENKNYGNNYKLKICNKSYIIGLKRNMNLVIYMTLYFVFLFVFFIIIFKDFYNVFLFISTFVFLSATIYNYLMSFLLEPGIIPRNYKHKQNSNFNINSNNSINNSNNNSNNNNSTNHNINSIENITADIDIINQTDQKEKLNDNNNKSFYIKKKKTIEIYPDFLDKNNYSTNNNVISINDDLDTYLDSYKNEKKRLKKEIMNNNTSLIFETEMNEKSNEKNRQQNNLNYIAYKNSISNGKLNDGIPYIFQKKQCYTCHIERPKKCSHCKICDNCILEMDHHCFYISNCVGIRNHKNFFLFLLFGSFLSNYLIVFVVYHIVYVYFLYDFNATKNLIKKFKFLFYFGFFIMVFPSIIFYVILRKILISIVLYLIGSIIEIFIFEINKKNYFENNNKNKFYHNLSLLMFIGLLPLNVFVNLAFWKQVKMIGKGLTIKQYSSILIQKENLKKEGNESYKNMDIFLNKKWNFGFLMNIILRKRKKSLINV